MKDFAKEISLLDAEWDESGFLGGVRLGIYNSDKAEKFLTMLRSLDIGETEFIPKRLMALLWYIPSFLSWQVERLSESGVDLSSYERFVNAVHNTLEEIIGTP